MKEKNKLKNILLVVFAFSFFAITGLNFIGVFDFLENKTYDSRMKITASFTKVNQDICFIGVDQQSINSAVAQKKWGWPWPRASYATLIDFLSKGNARAIVFDILFTEDSVYGKSDDEIFENSIKNSGVVVNAVHRTDEGSILFPIEKLKNASALLGNITSATESDGIIRKARIYYDLEGTRYPSLGLSSLVLDSSDSLQTLQELTEEIPHDKKDLARLRFKGSINRYAHYSAWEILESAEAYANGQESFYTPEDFEDAIVFIIFYAPGLYDICPTPVSQVYPGAGVHITELDNYLTNSFIKECPLWVTIFIILIFSFAGTFIVYFSERKTITYKTTFLLATIFSVILVFILFSYILFNLNIFIHIIAPIFCLTISFLISLTISYSLEGRQKKFIKAAFSQYLSPKVIELLQENPSNLKLGGEKKNISIFFSDIQSFTTLSEKLEPEKLTELLNIYLTFMTDTIIESGGTIDKYEGDAIIAFWNAPTEIPDHATRILKAALECQKKIAEKEDYFKSLVGRNLNTRIGINTGTAVVGNMGSTLRFDYTMIGDSVNLASRLEGINKQFGTYLMCSEETKKQALATGCTLSFRELSRVAVVGKTEAITVYEPMENEKYQQNQAVYNRFYEGLNSFYNCDLKSAISVFEELKDVDIVSKKYLEKSLYLLENKIDYKGIWVADSK